MFQITSGTIDYIFQNGKYQLLDQILCDEEFAHCSCLTNFSGLCDLDAVTDTKGEGCSHKHLAIIYLNSTCSLVLV